MRIFKSKEHGYVLELWGASTKHPDSIFFFDEFKKNSLFDDEHQVFQWLLECASKMTWPANAKDIADEAIEKWYPMDNDWNEPTLEEWTKEHWHPNYR